MQDHNKAREVEHHHQHLFSPSTDDLDHPSPPYKTLPYPENSEQSPAYASRSTVILNEKDMFIREKDDTDNDKPKPTVHYPQDLRGPAPSYHLREDSTDLLSLSRPASIAGTDDEFDQDDYDWSGEDDLVDQEAKFERRMGTKQKSQGWGFKKFITFLFSSLIGSTFLAGLIVAPALLVHFFWYIPHKTPQRHYINQNIQAWLFWAAANLLLSWYLALLIDILPSIVIAFISGAWGHVSESVKSKVEMYNSVKNTVKPLFYAASGWASWVIIFGGIYKLYDEGEPERSRAAYARRVSQVVAFSFFLVLVICIQRMLSHAIAFSFHRTAYQERIESVNTALSVIETLRDYRPKPPTSGSAPRSGLRTPVLGALGMGSLGFGALAFSRKPHTSHPTSDTETLMDEKEHYKSLNSALAMTKEQKRARGESDEVNNPVQYDGDTEEWGEGDGTVVGKKSGFDSLGKGKSRLDGIPMTASPGSSRPGTPSGLRNSFPGSPSNVGSHSHLNSYFAENGASSPHRYPPTPLAPPIPVHNIGLNTSSPRHSISMESNNGVVGGAAEVVTEAVEAVGEAVEKTAKVIKSAVLHDARNIRGKEGKDDEAEALAWNVANSKEAKRLARAIYLRFKDRRRNYLLPEDFYPAFPTPQAAEAAFRVFDKDNNGDISRAEIKTTLLKVYKERRFLSRSMRDVSQALRTLDQILLFFAFVILFFVSLSVFGVEVGDSLTSLYSLGIAASFVFKNAASEAFDAIMFLFVTHPYDTGDRVFIGEENLVVKKMGLFATVFTRSDGTETYYFNSQLFTKFITNVRRSGKMFENLTMQVAWRTPLVKLDALEKCLNEWLATEENRWYEPSTSVTLQHIDYQRFLEVTIGIGHNGTWQDWGLRNARKTAFHAAVQYYCRQLGIECYQSPLPIAYGDLRTGMWDPSTARHDGGSGGERFTPDEGVSREGSVFEERRGYEEGLGVGVGVGVGEGEGEGEGEKMKPVLGFLPPEATRTTHLRARKSKGKKAMMRGDF